MPDEYPPPRWLVPALRHELAALQAKAIRWTQICALSGYVIGIFVGAWFW